ncbi:MAG TPA: F0F1 ATP synthase subunit epsilon [Candidatus Parcubacteria bacterium]|nr:F0F1 ATP synthase subunit epsilon [Candidatus Parcubacteria bacterium]
MELKILSPEKKIYQGKVKKVILPGKNGQFQILEDHADLFAILEKGDIILEKGRRFPVFSGIVRVSGDKILVLIDS